MAAYGALVSVMQIIDQIQHHPRPPIPLEKEQVASLTKIITFLQEFLEGYNPHLSYRTRADPLESRIAEAAHMAEDVIESYIVDRILASSTNHGGNTSCFKLCKGLPMVVSYFVDKILSRSRNRPRPRPRGEKISSSNELHRGLNKVIEEMGSIKMEVVRVQNQLHSIKPAPFRPSSTAQKVAIAGFDQMLEKMVGRRLHLQIIPIVGMGGIGKTTLARNIYTNPLVQQHFDVRAWSTVSQVYNAQKILREILDQVDKEVKNKGDLFDDELGELLYKYLIGRRYLIVMDDMWSIEAWDKVRRFFPDNENGSRIVMTTRLSNLASQLSCSDRLDMRPLDVDTSWDLLSRTVFGKQMFPLELRDIGRKIVEGCQGLPLSIVVIGGFLSKSELTRENWQLIEKNLNSIVNLDDDGSCLQILHLSYNHLPVYIKPCFLYLGVLAEDDEIKVPLVIPLLVAEGFIKPCDGKSLEDVARDYIQELVDRNLVLVEKRDHCGNVKSCKVHDLLRDLCLREAQKHKFLCVVREQSIPQGISSQRRIANKLSTYPPDMLLQSLESASLVRSWIGRIPNTLSSRLRLLRVSVSYTYVQGRNSEYYEEIFRRLVNLRYFCVDADEHPLPRIPSSASFLWNLQTLVLSNVGSDYIVEIWKMPQLRHVMTYKNTLDGTYCLSCDNMDGEVVLRNLQTLFVISNLNFGEGMLKRIPNIKWLELYYSRGGEHHLKNLSCLDKLEVLLLISSSSTFQSVQELALPHSLKKLTLVDTKLHWDDMKTKIGLLPLLQVLKLKDNAFTGSQWETSDVQFSSLKFLLIDNCDLEYWITDSTHFPLLEHLVLRNLSFFGEIPPSIGDIPTLRSIGLRGCSEAVVDSARRILEEQEDAGNEDFQLQVLQ